LYRIAGPSSRCLYSQGNTHLGGIVGARQSTIAFPDIAQPKKLSTAGGQIDDDTIAEPVQSAAITLRAVELKPFHSRKWLVL
jgi:hypothetical protein